MSAKRAWQEPWMWLVIGLPASVVVAGFWTLGIALKNPETMVSAPHSKVGFTVQSLPAPASESKVNKPLPNNTQTE